MQLAKKSYEEEDDYDDYVYYEEQDENAKSLKDCISVIFLSYQIF